MALKRCNIHIGDNGASKALEGAVIFRNDDSNTSIDSSSSFKTEGFDTAVSSNYSNDAIVDKYTTYDLEVSKVTTGALADTTHDFPFEITLTGSFSNAVIADITITGASYEGTAPSTVSISNAASVLKPKMSNGDKILITGIPKGTSVTVKETNDENQTYTLTGTKAVGVNDTTKITNINQKLAKDASYTSESVEINGESKAEIEFTNTATAISPTGVIFRFAPYLLMFAFAMALLIMSTRRRRVQ